MSDTPAPGESRIAPDMGQAGEPAAGRPPQVSIVFCTRNRCALLDDALRSLFGIRFPEGLPIEVLVVDNASGDATRDVVARYASARQAAVQYVREPQPGLSNARNCALRHVRGAIVAFVDDDVLFDPGWLVALVRGFAEHPDAGCVGGRTRLAFEGAPPRWLTPYLASIYGVGIDEPLARPMRDPEHPYGLNMAFHRSVFDRVGDFSPRLGRIDGKLLSGEETELFARVRSAGIPMLYAPEVAVWHRVPRSRARVAWVLRRHYWGGASRAIADSLANTLTSRQCMQRAYYELRRLAGDAIMLVVALPRALLRTGNTPVEALARLAQRMGAASQYASLIHAQWRSGKENAHGPG